MNIGIRFVQLIFIDTVNLGHTEQYISTTINHPVFRVAPTLIQSRCREGMPDCNQLKKFQTIISDSCYSLLLECHILKLGGWGSIPLDDFLLYYQMNILSCDIVLPPIHFMITIMTQYSAATYPLYENYNDLI